MSRCGCSRSDFSTPRDRGGASIQGCHNCTSGIGDDGADPAYRTCAGRRIRTRPEAIVEPTSTFLRQPLTMRVAAVALEDSPRNTFVMALGKNEKMSVGFGELSGDTIVSLAARDLHNASREAESIELLDNASLSARSIFLSGGYALAVGAIMIASRYLTTHTSPVADPYSRLEVPPISDAREPATGWTSDRPKPFRRASIAGGWKRRAELGSTSSQAPYILDRSNFVVSGSNTVSETDLTHILTSRARSDYGAIDIRAGSTIEVTAPALGAAVGIPGIAIWVDGHAPAASDTFDGGRTQNINGAIYLPGRQVKICRRLTLRHPLQSADRRRGHVHRKFLFPA